MSLRFAEFFAGIGLVRLAAERAGYECVFANDLDPKKLEMYRGNFGTDEFVLGDVGALTADQIPDIDLATASFPCTDLSLAGGRAGLKGAQSGAVWPFLKLLRDMGPRKPTRVLLENVPGLMSMNAGADLEAILLEMNRLGYGADLWLVDAAWFVPQSRVRLFVIGRLGSFRLPSPRGEGRGVRGRPGVSPEKFIENHPQISWDLVTPPPPPKRIQNLEDLLDANPQNWWSKNRTEYLLSQIPELHRPRLAKTVTAFRRVRKGKTVVELRDDGVAGCLRTPKGGSARQIIIQKSEPPRPSGERGEAHSEYRARLLTPRECARLMGAPDYDIAVGDTQAYFGFGDAVVVPAVEWVLRNAFD